MMANELKDAQDISPKIVGAVLSNIVFDYEDVSGNPFAILYDTGLARIKYPRGNHVEFLRENPEQAAQEVRDVFTALAKGSSVEIHWTPKGLSLAELIEWLASNTTNKQCQSRADSQLRIRATREQKANHCRMLLWTRAANASSD
jgi:hypothetical protein